MEIFVSAVLIVLAAAFVALPFIRPEDARARSSAPIVALKLRDAERQKSDAYSAIKEAEFDFEMGKLSEVDFQLLRGKYANQAIAAIGVLEGNAIAVAEARPTRRGRLAYCPTCGTPVPKGANFCAGCGKGLKQLAA